jgi:hypothetical protein
LSLDIRDTGGPEADALEFPGLPELPEVLDPSEPNVLDLRDPPPVLDLREPDFLDFAELEVLDLGEPAVSSEPPAPERAGADAIPCSRLLDRAKPSLAEAAALASLVLEALGTMHDAGCTHGDLDSQSVQIGLRGDVRLAGGKPKPASRARFDPDQRRADIRAAAGIVAEITKSAGRPARPLTDREEKLVARLEAAADPRSLSRRGPLPAARGLEIAVGSAEQRRAARNRLQGLIRAVAATDLPSTDGPDLTVGHGQGGSGHGGLADAGVPRGLIAETPPARRLPPPARRPPLSPRVRKGAVIAAVVALILGVELHFFGDAIKRNVEVLFNGTADAAPADPGKAGPLPVLGPPAAGPITHLELRPLDGCRPDAVCNTVVQITVAPQPAPLDVAWAFTLVDRCGGRQEPRPGGVFSIPPGKDRAVETVAVPIPAGRGLTLVPVTSSPVKVAGTPLPLSADTRPC